MVLTDLSTELPSIEMYMIGMMVTPSEVACKMELLSEDDTANASYSRMAMVLTDLSTELPSIEISTINIMVMSSMAVRACTKIDLLS